MKKRRVRISLPEFPDGGKKRKVAIVSPEGEVKARYSKVPLSINYQQTGPESATWQLPGPYASEQRKNEEQFVRETFNRYGEVAKPYTVEFEETIVYGKPESKKRQQALISDYEKYFSQLYKSGDYKELGLPKSDRIQDLESWNKKAKAKIAEVKKANDQMNKRVTKIQKTLGYDNPQDVLSPKGLEDLRQMYKDNKIPYNEFMDAYNNVLKPYDPNNVELSKSDQELLRRQWYGENPDVGFTEDPMAWLSNPMNAVKVAKATAVAAPLAPLAPAVLANPFVQAGLTGYGVYDAATNTLPEAYRNFSEGDYGKGFENLAWAGLDLMPGMVFDDMSRAAKALNIPRLNKEVGIASSIGSIGKTEAAIKESSGVLNRFAKKAEPFANVLGATVALPLAPLTKRRIKKGNKWLEEWINNPSTKAKIDADIQRLINERINIHNKTVDDLKKMPDWVRYQINDTGMSKERAEEFRRAWEEDVTKSIKEEGNKTQEAIQRLADISELQKGYKPSVALYPYLQRWRDVLSGKKDVHSGNFGVSYRHHVEDPLDEVRLASDKKDRTKGTWVANALLNPFKMSTTIHEGTHDWLTANLLKLTGQEDIIMSSLSPKAVEKLSDWRAKGYPSGHSGYYADPTEIHARTMELRKHFRLNPEQKITPEDFDNMRKRGVLFGISPEYFKAFKSNEAGADVFNKVYGYGGLFGTY